MNIGEKIKQAIREAGLTQHKLADKLGITNPVVNVWCTGKRLPSPPTLKRIAEATGKPLSFFTGEDKFDKSNLELSLDKIAKDIQELKDKQDLILRKLDK